LNSRARFARFARFASARSVVFRCLFRSPSFNHVVMIM
jgi:hypothetical protein